MAALPIPRRARSRQSLRQGWVANGAAARQPPDPGQRRPHGHALRAGSPGSGQGHLAKPDSLQRPHRGSVRGARGKNVQGMMSGEDVAEAERKYGARRGAALFHQLHEYHEAGMFSKRRIVPKDTPPTRTRILSSAMKTSALFAIDYTLADSDARAEFAEEIESGGLALLDLYASENLDEARLRRDIILFAEKTVGAVPKAPENLIMSLHKLFGLDNNTFMEDTKSAISK